ncbi:prepilin peptidase [Streptomyces sp. NA04227]|uniref:prepilin peptidase n=1 Tax=Streptomyces sp. NA04227 TaxID=2742136 RepID=UPI001590FAD5|nr:A24 family peptidase [Streptomyces sp. NA04227]QKW08483.1 prepilin peptidase [Streptomyces sp. NA04227]
MTTALWLVPAAALWGAAAGVLLPRPAYRLAVPSGEDWHERTPRGRRFTGPGRGWLGPARDGGAYGPSTPLTSLATALVCGALAHATGARPELGAWLLLAPVFVLLAMVDFRVQRLPDALTLPLAGGSLLLLGGAALLPDHGGRFLGSVYGVLGLGLLFFVLFLISPRGMGFGDVKLALGLGAVLGWYGWGALVTGVFVGFLLGALYGVGLVALRKAGRKSSIPFGPFLIAGAFLGVLLGGYAA